MNKVLKSEFVVYGIVGVGVTLLKLLALFLLRDIFGVATHISVTISYIIAVVTHFFVNKHITFKIKNKNVANVMTVKYFLALIVAFVFYGGNIYILNKICNLHFYVAVFIALFLSFIFNYFLYKHYVFKR